jgi:hypothetical protein
METLQRINDIAPDLVAAYKRANPAAAKRVTNAPIREPMTIQEAKEQGHIVTITDQSDPIGLEQSIRTIGPQPKIETACGQFNVATRQWKFPPEIKRLMAGEGDKNPRAPRRIPIPTRTPIRILQRPSFLPPRVTFV